MLSHDVEVVRRMTVSSALVLGGSGGTGSAVEILESHLCGRWVAGRSAGVLVRDAVAGQPVARVSSDGLDLAAAAAYARDTGGPALRDPPRSSAPTAGSPEFTLFVDQLVAEMTIKAGRKCTAARRARPTLPPSLDPGHQETQP